MDIMKLATQMLASKLTGSAGGNSDMIQSVIGNLLGGSGNISQGGLDLGSLVGNLQEKGFGDIAQSWLGDGDNAEISDSQVEELLGAEKIQQAASQLGADQGELLQGLKKHDPPSR